MASMPESEPVKEGRRAMWEERALVRSLEPARARSSVHAHALVDAARAAIDDEGPTFTVQQVAARAGMSVKTFYRYFSGKDALLLALFEEDNSAGVQAISEMLVGCRTPLERLRRIILGFFELSTARPHEDYALFVMREYFRLSQAHSEEVEHVLNPYVDLIAGELEAAQARGDVELPDPRRSATAVFLTTVSHLCPLVLADREADPASAASFVADFCLRALGAPA
jgi:TetR/AcrR family transcriptional regulator